MNDNLKSCPFCGGEGSVLEANSGFYAACKGGNCRVMIGYHSSHDDDWGFFETREDAIVAWNTRGTGEKTMGGIFRRLATDNGITLDDIRGVSRVRNIAWLRQQGMLESRRLGFTYGQIADYLFRDKSTIISGIREAKKRDK